MKKIFTYDKDLYVVCYSENRGRSGFNHIGKIFYKNKLVCTDKIKYYNRTWEAWEYQSILRSCENWIDNNLKLEHFKRLSTCDYIA